MFRVDFKDEEAILMKEILESYLHELSSEISSTDTLSFRQDLKLKKVHLMDMLNRLGEKAA
ncbi:MAG: hypothetical protein ACOYXY_08495 [Thermodesulfobacteriota bacterium]